MNRLMIGLVAALLAACCVFFGTARADEKAEKMAGCSYCKAVKDVTSHMRCDGCAKADKACEKCAAMAKKVAETAACRSCNPEKGAGECGGCKDALKKADGECEFCAEKKLVAEHSYCCMGCAKAKKTDCAKCKEVRDAVMAVKCEGCAKEGKK